MCVCVCKCENGGMFVWSDKCVFSQYVSGRGGVVAGVLATVLCCVLYLLVHIEGAY